MQYYYDTEGVLRPTQEELRKSAYELYLRRGQESGHELDDWLRAENQLCRLSEEQLHESRLAEYKEVAQNFRTLTDIRFKLLSFLPIGPVLITLSTAWTKGEIGVPLSLFGLVVTLALIVYNERNNQLYDELVSRAAQLERLLGLPGGNFSQRPKSWLRIRPVPETPDAKFAVPIEHGWAIGTIYQATIVAWLFMLFSSIFIWLLTKSLLVAHFHSSPAKPLSTQFPLIPLSTVFALIMAISVCQLFFKWFESINE
jgi:Protein of unknown function (DUF2934)